MKRIARLLALVMAFSGPAQAWAETLALPPGPPPPLMLPAPPPAPLAMPPGPTETPVAVPTTQPAATPVPTSAPKILAPGARVVKGIKGDITGGGWIAATLLSAGSNFWVRQMRGEEPDDAARHAAQDLGKPEFLVGNLLAGSAGAALGSALPLPMVLAKAPLFVRALGTAAAPLTLAALGATVATTAIALHRRGQLTGANLMHAIDWTNLAAQTVGSLIGMSAGTALVAAGLAPALALGSVALIPLLGGILGSIGAAELLHWLRSRKVDPAKAATAASPPSASAPDALPGHKPEGLLDVSYGEAGHVVTQPASANVVSNVAIADPYADLPNVPEAPPVVEVPPVVH